MALIHQPKAQSSSSQYYQQPVPKRLRNESVLRQLPQRITCTFCGGGHHVRDCRKQTGECFHCGDTGHKVCNCPGKTGVAPPTFQAPAPRPPHPSQSLRQVPPAQVRPQQQQMIVRPPQPQQQHPPIPQQRYQQKPLAPLRFQARGPRPQLQYHQQHPQ